MKRKFSDRVLSLFLSLVMVFSSIPINSFATTSEGDETIVPDDKPNYYLFIDQQTEFGSISDVDATKEYIDIFEELDDEETAESEPNVEPTEPKLLFKASEYAFESEANLKVNIEDGYQLEELIIQEFVKDAEISPEDTSTELVEPKQVEYTYDEEANIVTFVVPEFDVLVSASFSEEVSEPIDLNSPSDTCTDGSHNYTSTKIDPTCTSDGFTTNVCLNCGDTYVSDEIKSEGHQYDEKITKEATETEEGVKTFTCYLCGDSYEEAIPAIKKEDNLIKNPAPDVSDLIDGESTTADVYIRELSTQLFYGTESTGDGNVWTAKDYDKGHRFSFRINYAISGVDVAPENTVRLTIPKSILNTRNAERGDYYEMSIPSLSEVEAYLNGTGESIDNDVNFAYYENGSEIIIYNFRELPAGYNGYIELSYYTSQTTYHYVDMEAQSPFTCIMTAPMNSMEAEPIVVKINTTARITSTNKRYPTKYTTWQPAWGNEAKPANAENYHYLVWTIESYINATQPYNFTLEDTITGNFDGMEVVGYKFSGQSEFTTLNTIRNQTIRDTRYDYVITSIPLDVYQPENYWEANNTIIATVDPVDQIDADTQATDIEKWSWTKPKFEGVTGHVNVYKRADGAHRTLCMNGYSVFYGTEHRASSLDFECSEYTRYDMESFNGYNGAEITNTELDGFKYASWIVGYPYPWTYDSSYNDPLNPDAYGKIPVKYELIDEGVCLTADNNNVADNSEMLTSEDFRFESLSYSFLMTDATFDEDAQNFKEVTVTYTENDVITFYGKFGTSDEWVQFASFNLYTKEKVFDENYVKSMTNKAIVFNNNVDLIAYKLETTNAHYYTELFTVPHLTLKNSQTVMDYVTGKAAIGILNHNKGNFYEYEAPITNEASEISTVDETADDPYAIMPLAFDSRLYEISKVDENGNPVIGATLQIVEIETDGGVKTGNEHVQYEWVSDGNPYKFSWLEIFDEYSIYDNSYHVLREVLAPEGYELADDIVIDPDTEGTTYITMIDEKNEPIIPNKLFAELTAEDTEYARISQRYSDIEKSIVSVSNNPKKKTFTISWRVEQEETMEWGFGGDREYIPQNGGTFYDLLPEGATFDKKSVDVQVGYNKFLPPSAYTVETIDNFKGTGRIMLIIKIKETANNYVVYYDTLHPWNSIKDYGNDVYNPVAYETGNSSITNGFPDNGGKYFSDGTENPNAIKDYQIMSNLNPDSEDPTAKTFIYAQKYYDIVAITAASSGLMKKVKAENDSSYSYETTTTINGNYSYQLRYMNSYTSVSKNMIFYDSLENYDYDTMRNYGTLSDWRGTLQSIDVNQLESKGIAPVVYYSTISKLDIEMHHDISDASVWKVLTDSTDLSTVKAVAIDMRKTVDGKDFILAPGDSVVATLHMKAPSVCPEKEGDYAYTYNNIYISDTVMDAENITGQDFLIHQDYTSVKLLVTGSFGLEKVSVESDEIKIPDIEFRLMGTSHYGTEIDEVIATDSNGQIYFEDIEMGSYILQEYKSTDDWLLDTTEYRVVIDNLGKVWIDDVEYTESYLIIKNNPRIHGDITFYKKELGDDTTGILGTTFSLTGVSDYGTETLMYSTSAANGKIEFKNIELGTYELKEIQSNPNYVLNDIIYTVKIDENGEGSIISSNEVDEDGNPILLENSKWYKKSLNGIDFIYNRYKYYEIELRKVDANNNTIFLEGATFSLVGLSNYDTKVNLIASSDKNGYIAFNGIEEGTYILKEVQAPTNVDSNGNIGGTLNYVLDESEYIVNIDSKGNITIEGLEQEENTGYFIVKNNRAYDKLIVITKIWEDGLTNEERIEQGIIPKLHLTNRDLSQDENFHTHTWDEGTVISVATCSQNGETLYTCTDCGMTNVQKSAKLEHTWDDGKMVSEASCTSQGETLYMCEVCETTKSEKTEVLPHAWDEGVIAISATCTSEGEMLYTCTTGCGTTKNEPIAMLPHNFTAEDGSCIECGELPYLYSNVVLKGPGTATVSVSTSDYDYYNASNKPYYSKIITFVPAESGTYTFTAGASVDTFGRLYDSEMKSLSYNDDGSGSNFKITYTCTAGTVYYLAAGRYSNSSSSTSIPVTITKTS